MFTLGRIFGGLLLLFAVSACGGGGGGGTTPSAPGAPVPTASPTPMPKPGVPTATPTAATSTPLPTALPPTPTPQPAIPASVIAIGTLQGHGVNLFAPNANGSATPMRTVTLATSSIGAAAVAFDSVGNLYVCDLAQSAVFVFAPTASGSAAPVRTIRGPATGIGAAYAIAVDAANNVYVGNSSGTIEEFGPTANGNASPSAVIAGSATGMQSQILQALTVDPAGNLYAAVQANATTASIVVFSPHASGNVAPMRTIAGPQTGLNGPIGLANDAAGNLYVVNSANTILVFPPGANGDVNVSRLIYSTALDKPAGIAVDRTGNIYVVNQSGIGGGGYVVFAAGTNGVGVPLYQVGGTNVVWDQAYGIAVF